MAKVHVYIEKKFNPFVSTLREVINKSVDIELTEKSSEAGVIISFSYHNKDDVVEMATMGEVINKKGYEEKKFIFLSWFHPWNDEKYYRSLFSPEKATCVLMDTDRYHILQLPVTKNDIIESISFLSKADHEK